MDWNAIYPRPEEPTPEQLSANRAQLHDLFSSRTWNSLDYDTKCQAVQALDNLGAVLRAAGMDYCDVAKTTVFLSDMGNFAAVNEIYARYFPGEPPARSCVQAVLPKGGLVEVECIAEA